MGKIFAVLGGPGPRPKALASLASWMIRPWDLVEGGGSRACSDFLRVTAPYKLSRYCHYLLHTLGKAVQRDPVVPPLPECTNGKQVNESFVTSRRTRCQR